MAGYMNAEQKERMNHIPNGVGNDAIKHWFEDETERTQEIASPSSLTTCPRVQWLVNHKVPATTPMGWGLKQRLELGRITENDIAAKLANRGALLVHFRDDPPMRDCYPVPRNTDMIVKQVDGTYKAVPGIPKFKYTYKGEVIFDGVPDYLLVGDQDDGSHIVTVSDCKTSRADSFAYIPIENPWTDYGWWKYKLQVTAYYMMVNQSGFLKTDIFKGWDFSAARLGNLMSYALDDGIVKRDVTWIPTEDDQKKVIAYAMRLNAGIKSETMPPCTCGDTPIGEWDGIPWATKFCRYATVNNNIHMTKSGTKFYRECCSDELAELVK